MTLQILIWSVNVKFGAFLTLDALLFSALPNQKQLNYLMFIYTTFTLTVVFIIVCSM